MKKRQNFIIEFVTISLCILTLLSYNTIYATEILKSSNIVKIDTSREKVDPYSTIIDLNKLKLDYNNLYSDNEFSRLSRIVNQAMEASIEGDMFIKIKYLEGENEEKFREAIEDINSYYAYSFQSYEMNGKKDLSGVYNFKMKFNYKETKNEREELDKWIKDQINTHVLHLKTDVEKIKKINEIIAKAITYDNSLVKTTAYQGVFQGGTVCDGYAVLGHRMLVAAGFKDSMTIVGYGTNNGVDFVAHRWNMVRLNNKWYHIDFTFNDTGGILEAYLLKSDEYMKKNHKWDSIRYPISD